MSGLKMKPISNAKKMSQKITQSESLLGFLEMEIKFEETKVLATCSVWLECGEQVPSGVNGSVRIPGLGFIRNPATWQPSLLSEASETTAFCVREFASL